MSNPSGPDQCPTGTEYKELSSVGECNLCGPEFGLPEGFYCGDGVEVMCPAGYYCPWTDGASPLECPEGSYCREGLASPLHCSTIQHCPAGSQSRKVGWGGAIIVIAVGLASIGLSLLLGWLKTRKRVKADSAGERHKKTSKLLNDLTLSLTGTYPEAMTLQGFTNDIKQSPVRISFDNLSMTIKSNGATVLDGVTGEFPPGALVALMGPSGGGKTTFMNALCGRAPYGNVSGDIYVNGVPGGVSKFPRLVGFVPQDDILHGDLSVYDNLYYSALIRLPKAMSTEQKKKIIDDVLVVLDLERIKHSIVGTASKRGISGGQRKRVNIGMELVAYPRLLFLDEPTSGLDSAASLQVAHCLSKMRSLGITVVCVIHQPRYSIFRTFTHCLLLGRGGRTVFLGSTGDVEDYFTRLGFRLPAGENVADWFIDVICGSAPRYLTDGSVDRSCEPSGLFDMWSNRAQPSDEVVEEVKAPPVIAVSEQETSSPTSANGLHPAFMEEVMLILGAPRASSQVGHGELYQLCRAKGVECEQGDMSSLFATLLGGRSSPSCTVAELCATLEAQTGDSSKEKALDAATLEGQGDEPLVDRVQASPLKQMVLLCQRNLVKWEFTAILARLAMTFVAGVIVGTALGKDLDYNNLPTNFQMAILLFGIIVSGSSLYVFGDEVLTFRRESAAGMSVTAYWLSKNLTNLIDGVLLALVFEAVLYNLTQPDFNFFTAWCVAMLVMWYVQGFAHLMSVLLPAEAALLAAIIIPALMVGMFGGTNPTWYDMSRFQQGLAYIGLGLYSIELTTIEDLKALPVYVRDNPTVVTMLNTYNYDLDNTGRDVALLLLIGLAWRLGTYLVLLYQRKPLHLPSCRKPESS